MLKVIPAQAEQEAGCLVINGKVLKDSKNTFQELVLVDSVSSPPTLQMTDICSCVLQ